MKTSLGSTGEQTAEKYLIKHGYKILERNFRLANGEIDIIATDGSVLVFIEVKARKSTQYGTPLEAITSWKLKFIARTAEYYKVTHKNLPDEMRIDAVSIVFGTDGSVKEIELVKNISGW
jgi:putative endonuclease